MCADPFFDGLFLQGKQAVRKWNEAKKKEKICVEYI